jgi:hypothetical protein
MNEAKIFAVTRFDHAADGFVLDSVYPDDPSAQSRKNELNKDPCRSAFVQRLSADGIVALVMNTEGLRIAHYCKLLGVVMVPRAD